MVPPGERAAPCPTTAVPEGDRDRRDEGEGEGDVVLLLGGRRHGEQDRERLGVEITPTRDGRDACRFIRRVLKTCTNTPMVLVDGGPWHGIHGR